MVITGTAVAAERFDNLARNLPLIVTTLTEFLTGVWEGPDSAWRREGRPAALSDFAWEQRDHHWQTTGQTLDSSKPSSGVWDSYQREEAIWLDLQGEGLYGASPPIGPEFAAALDHAMNQAKARPSATEPVSTLTPPEPPPAPVSSEDVIKDRARRRRELLREIHRLLPVADDNVEESLRAGNLSEAERLCLRRVRAIINYGAYRHNQANRHNQEEERDVERLLQRCIMLDEEHRLAVRSGHRLWWLTMSENQTNPRQMFRSLLKHYQRRHDKDNASTTFDSWFKTVEREARARRRTRTIESDNSPGDSAA